jgi:hypothetical protein
VKVEAADLDGLDEGDFAAAADNDLAAADADVDDHVDVVLVLLAADEALEAAVEGAGLDVEGLDDAAGLVQLLDELVDLVAACGEEDDFLSELVALADFAGGEEVDGGVVRVEGINVAGLELDDGGELGGGHGGEAEVLGVDDLARECGHDAAPAERVLAEHLADQGGGGLEAEGGLGADFCGEGTLGGGGDGQRVADDFELEHLDAVMPDVDSDRENL